MAAVRPRVREQPAATPQDVLELCERKGIQMVDLRFTDLVGGWQHFSLPVEELSEDVFTEGVGFDGSSIRGFQDIHESDMILVPDPRTARVDPMCKTPTLILVCDVYDPVTRERYSRDPRGVAQRAEEFLVRTGIATTSYWGPEAEFFVFDDVRFDQNVHCGYYFVDSAEGAWNTGRDERPNLGYKPRYKEGYFPVPPTGWRPRLWCKFGSLPPGS
jgi:glutamine synthetase